MAAWAKMAIDLASSGLTGATGRGLNLFFLLSKNLLISLGISFTGMYGPWGRNPVRLSGLGSEDSGDCPNAKNRSFRDLFTTMAKHGMKLKIGSQEVSEKGVSRISLVKQVFSGQTKLDFQEHE